MKSTGHNAAVSPTNVSTGEHAALTVDVLEHGGRGQWDEYVANHPRARLYHQSAWQPLVEAEFRHETRYLWARDTQGQVAGVLPLVRLKSRLFGDYMVSVPFLNYGGALGRDESTERLLMDEAALWARERGVNHIEFRDEHDRGGEWRQRTDKVTLELELPADADTLWRSIGTKKRTRIRRPTKAGAVVTHGGAELLDAFYKVFSRNMRDLGTPVYSRRFFAALLNAFPDQTSLTVITLDGVPAAAAFLVRDGERMEIPWASALREHNRLAVNMLLYWVVLQRSIEEGARVFDFGRSSVGAGTYQFKLQWGAEPRQLFWHYWLSHANAMPNLTPSNPKFQLAIKAWQRLPVPVANLIGPHIVRNLP